jgi:hypothetical protein
MAIAAGRAERAVLICGSGAGVTVAANKLPLVRACVAHDTYTAHQMVEHDCCNVMTLGARAVGVEVARELVRTFVDARFSGADRHRARSAHAAPEDMVDRFGIGSEVVRWEYAIAMAGAVLGIDPFDQPDVEAAKQAAAKVLEQGMPHIPIEPVEAVLSTVEPGDYIAIQAFIDTESLDVDALQRVPMPLRDRYRVATTVGIGPRYLHSTGQPHKGGAPSGVFLQTVGDDPIDVAIPGRSFNFSQLKQAQAAGDYLALRDNGRRVARVARDDLVKYAR